MAWLITLPILSNCIVYVVCTDVQSALRKGSTTTIQKEVSEEALGGN